MHLERYFSVMSFEAELDLMLLSSYDNIGFRCYQNVLVR